VLSSTMPLLSITLYLIRHYQAVLISVFPFSESLQAARRLSFCKVRFPPFWLIESLQSFGNIWVLPRVPVSISSISGSVQDLPPSSHKLHTCSEILYTPEIWVLTAANLSNAFLWIVVPFHVVSGCQNFRLTHRLHLHDWSVWRCWCSSEKFIAPIRRVIKRGDNLHEIGCI
jgi:hypothetical protein